ncbi:MAG TPA: PfkB family carbohydrate kinase [Chthoniobacter sp.]|jgi:sugar/nucleoside kinase (ribokinase family)
MKTSSTCYDVLGLGCATVDDIYHIPSFPAADAKVRVSRHERRGGGLTGNALVAAARLGARCAYAGCLGEDDASDFVEQDFLREGVDVSEAPRPEGAAVIHSAIIVGQDTGSRNIFYRVEGIIGAHPTLPQENVIASARVLFIDHYGMAGNLRAARIARAAGNAVVADFEDAGPPPFAEVLALTDHLILSEESALRISGKDSAAEAAMALWRDDRAAVIVTCGAAGCWSVTTERERQPQHHPAFQVKCTDTTGCGDVFHGAYAAQLAAGRSLDERIAVASAAAALRASRGLTPNRADVEEFLARQTLNVSPP